MTAQQEKGTEENLLPFYSDSYAHIKDELRKLDLLIKRNVAAFRVKLQAMQKNIPAQRMYISHEEIDWLLSQQDASYTPNTALEDIDKQLDLLQNSINAKVRKSVNQGIPLTLYKFARLFGLSNFELQAVIVCLASELDRKYDKLYAYLQDDITRKKPSVDLILDLLCQNEASKWQMRSYFSDSALLIRIGILHKKDDFQSPSGSSGLAQLLQLNPRILCYLLGNNSFDERVVNIVSMLEPLPSMEAVLVDQKVKLRLLHFVEKYFSGSNSGRMCAVLHLYGPYGIGKKELARALCGQLNCPVVYLDMELLRAQDSDQEEILRLVFREGLLFQGALYIDNADLLLNDDNNSKALARKLARLNNEYGWLTFLAGEKPWKYKGLFNEVAFISIELSIPDVPLRKIAWESSIVQYNIEDEKTWSGKLANQFRFTPGQIQDAVRFAKMQEAVRDDEEDMTLHDLFKASRCQSNQKLGELALKIDPHYSWEDIVLPEDKLAQLKEICSQVKYRYTVFGEWGFDEKLVHGKGLSVLFSGPSGTGKTMAAEVIAHELNLDLYKIDLSGVVSKYIGETEKNLAKVFQEAESSNAILFFDEADALFGKRTDVSDAHDRYANIETSYLLQRMEEYEGMVVLATNLRDNMDDAFTRRIRFIVEFPFPDEVSRMKIWRTHFPRKAPLSEEIDYEYLSKKIPVAGGNIKNIVLNAAFLAADNGGVIGMNHILYGAKREFEKIGKLWNEKILAKSLDSKL